jgi:predicted permease
MNGTLFRRLRQSPLFASVILLTLAIGIGANTAIFSVVNSILLRPLPYPESDRLIGLWHTAKGLNIDELNMCPTLYWTDREQSHSFVDVGLYDGGSVAVSRTGKPEQVRSMNVTDGFLPILGIKPEAGRFFNKRDDTDGSPRTIVLCYAYWRSHYGSDRSVIGNHIRVDGLDREIIGVLPQSFRFMSPQPQVLLPFQFDRANAKLGNFSYSGVARLKQGVTLASANADLARLVPIWLASWPAPPGFSAALFADAKVAPALHPFMQDVVGDIGKVLWVVMSTIGVVLLIACANVANLLLVRAEGRQHELAIRAALGAGWKRLASDLLGESLWLGIVGGILGLGLAYACLQILIAIGPSELPRLDEIRIDPWALLFTFAISLFSGLLFGLIPVFKYAFVRPTMGLRDSNRNASAGQDRLRARNLLAISQVALALVLLVGSGLMIRTFFALRQIQPGFTEPEHLQTLQLFVPETQIKDGVATIRAYQEILNRIKAIPGVQSAGLVNAMTMSGSNSNDVLQVEDHPVAAGKLPPIRRFKFVAPGFFGTVGRPLLAGRDITWSDLYDFHHVVLVSEHLARQTWGSPAAAIGKRVREGMKDDWRQVVGVVGDEYDDGLQKKPPEIVYWPILMDQFWGDHPMVRRYQTVVIRTERAGTTALLSDLQRAIWSIAAESPLAEVRTQADIYRKSMVRISFTLVMLSIAGSMALILSLVGLYGVISYSVSQRRREIGIRMALGARQEQVSGMFVRQGFILAGVGILVGSLAALACTRLLQSLLFEVSTADPLTYALTMLALVAAAVLASYLPSRRATTIDPTEALRAE